VRGAVDQRRLKLPAEPLEITGERFELADDRFHLSHQGIRILGAMGAAPGKTEPTDGASMHHLFTFR
jgi:hypothetical protein